MSSRCCKVTSRCKASSGRSRSSLLLYLPEELSNHIYDYLEGGTNFFTRLFLTRTPPLSETCHQLRHEFVPVHGSLPISSTTTFTIYSEHFDPCDLILSLQRVPKAVSGAGRKSIFRVDVSGCLTSHRIQASVKQLTESTAAARTVATTDFKLHFNNHGILFAWLAKQYRLYSSDAEQRFWEKAYWAFAGATEEIDGIRMRAFGMLTLELPGGGFALV
ncbi:hypothetical protein D0862_11326 [Hortaea werneckii]|uniref:F-box domain-containing protein n=1 Tax=Hortaea werneckii TaxID=91943 RepID=A0A3M7F7N2_HORWE|nr:hypothetical protein D0863_11231 [Hortaea werneckii]RMY84813.1 hypothetical protein D0862_11326 [Hortaea werneckii]